MKATLTCIILVLLALCGSVSAQTTGTLDPTFNGTGKVVYDRDNMDLYQDVKVQPDGRIVTVGTSYNPSWAAVIEVTRYNTDGSFDASFGTGGHYNYSTGVETGANKCIIKNNGKILICGYTTDYATYSMVIIQLNANGTPDATFGTQGVVITQTNSGEKNAFSMALQGDGKILLAGYAVNSDYRNAPVVLRFSSAGVLDTSFGTNGVATVPVTEIDNDFAAVSVQSDGKIVAAGHISNGMSWFSLLVARFDQNGILDPGYGTAGVVNLNIGNVDDEFFDMVLTGNDQAILTGFVVSQADLSYHLLLMKLTNGGYPSISFGLDGYTTWGDVPYTFGDAMVLQPDGKILVAGCTGALAPGNNDWALWRFEANGNIDNTFGTNGVVTTEFSGNADEALGIALSQDKIVIAGKTRNAANKLDFAVARYMNDVNVSVSVPESADLQKFSVSPNPVQRNGNVSMTYKLNEAENVSIEMVNMTGSVVMTLPIGNKAAGNHTSQFNLPANITGGIYFLRIRGKQGTYITTKLVVID